MRNKSLGRGLIDAVVVGLIVFGILAVVYMAAQDWVTAGGF